MVLLHRLRIPKSALASLPERELAIVLGGGKILNELNITTKHAQYCINTLNTSPDDATRAAAFASVAVFIRILAGHVAEANQFFKKVVRVRDLKNDTGLLNLQFNKDVKELNTYFGKKNILDEMRNKFSFHTDSEILLTSFNATESSFSYEAMSGSYCAYQVYFGSEEAVLRGLQYLLPDMTFEAAANAIYVETVYIATLLSRIYNGILICIFSEYLGLTLESAATVEAADGPLADQVTVPFFSLPPESAKKSRKL